jgi:hypothetical protein
MIMSMRVSHELSFQVLSVRLMIETRIQFISSHWASKDVARRIDQVQNPLTGARECALSDGKSDVETGDFALH